MRCFTRHHFGAGNVSLPTSVCTPTRFRLLGCPVDPPVVVRFCSQVGARGWRVVVGVR